MTLIDTGPLVALIDKGDKDNHNPSGDEWKRVRELMEKYQDTPMDLADASLVALAEVTGLKRILTLDSDFYAYKINGKDAFDIIPLNSE
jgi:predicted nucleic acid-binding protein